MQFDNERAYGGFNRRDFLRRSGAVIVGGAFLLSTAPRVLALAINPRSSWATNRPPKGPLKSEDVRFLLVHHSASRNGHTSADAPAILRSFYDFHTGPEKGWNDIAYNFLIDAEGGIWEGRSGSLDGPVAGDATGGNQGFSQQVCLIGDYNAVQPSSAAKQSLALLLAWLADRYKIDTSPGATVSFVSRGSNRWPSGASVTTPTITGHRTMSQTTCPGDNLYAYVTGALVGDVNAARGGSAPASTATNPPTSVAPSSTAPPPSTSTSEATTTSIDSYTTTSPDPIPSTSSTTAATSSIATTSTTLVNPTSTTTIGALAAKAVPPGNSPLIWGGIGVAGLASVLLVWRNRRMSG